MEILGIGPMELILILVIALIIMGPNDMVKTGRTIGKFLRQLVQSPTWQAVQQTSRDLRYLPNKLMREAGIEEEMEQMKEIGSNVSVMTDVHSSLIDEINKVEQDITQNGKDFSAWTTPPVTTETPTVSELSIQKPAVEGSNKPPESNDAGQENGESNSAKTPPASIA
jgi:Sec-independent protein translocase protein TatA